MAIHYLNELEEYKDGKNKEERYSIAILKSEAYLSILQYPSLYDPILESELVRHIKENLKNLISIKPEDYKAYHMLFEYYSEIKGDLEEALRILDTWANSWSISAQRSRVRKQSVDWLQYYAARLCSMAVTRNSAYTLEAITRYTHVLKDQPTNTHATRDLIELLDQLSEEQLGQACDFLMEHLIAVDTQDCPLTHAVIRILFCMEDSLQLNSVDSPSQALFVLVRGPEKLLDQAKKLLREIGSGSRQAKLGKIYQTF